MKRLHLHVSVPDLDQSIRFYATLFGAQPSVVKDDYAKWMLDDPRVNFAISARGRDVGVDHVGIQVDSTGELAVLAGRLKAAGAETFDEQATTCCYAQSDKSWVQDPGGIAWEAYHTMADAELFNQGQPVGSQPAQAACCAPKSGTAPEVVSIGDLSSGCS